VVDLDVAPVAVTTRRRAQARRVPETSMARCW
jgi:hypothetical protein